MKNNNNNLTSASAAKRNRRDDGTKIAMMANDIAIARVTSEKLRTYQDKHGNMLYHTIINLMDAPNHNANDTFTIDGKLYNFTASGYEAVLKSFDTIRRKLGEAQTASEKLPGMESAYAGLISEVLGVNLEDATNVDDTNVNTAKMEGDNMDNMKKKYIVIDTSKGPDENTAEEIRNAFRISNMHAFDIEICDAGHRSRRIGVVTTGHNKALKIVLDYLGGGMPSFREFYETGVTYDLGFGRRWCVGDICITSDEGVFNRLTETILIDKDCGPTKLSASEPGHLTPLLDEEKQWCNNCDERGNKEVCQGCFDCEEGVQPLEPSNNCDGEAEPDSDASPEDTATPPQTVKQVSIPVGYPEVVTPMMKSVDVPDIEALDVNAGDIGLNLTTGDMTDISGNITFNVSGDIIIDSFNGGRNNTNRK